MIADAYKGSEIETSIKDYLNAATGNYRENIEIGSDQLQIGDSANVLVFVGHNGLMDFDVVKPDTDNNDTERDAKFWRVLVRSTLSR